MSQSKPHPLVTLGICLVAFPFVMVATEVIFVDTATKLGIPPQKYPRLVVLAFRFFNGRIKSVGTAIVLTGFFLAFIGISQSRKH